MSKRKHSATSKEAELSFTKQLKEKHHEKILDALDKLGIGIYTDIAIVALMDAHAVARRLNELEGMGKVWKAGGKKLTPSGRNAYLYQLTEPTKTDAEVRYNKNQPTAAEHAIKLIQATQQPKLF